MLVFSIKVISGLSPTVSCVCAMTAKNETSIIALILIIAKVELRISIRSVYYKDTFTQVKEG